MCCPIQNNAHVALLNDPFPSLIPPGRRLLFYFYSVLPLLVLHICRRSYLSEGAFDLFIDRRAIAQAWLGFWFLAQKLFLLMYLFHTHKKGNCHWQVVQVLFQINLWKWVNNHKCYELKKRLNLGESHQRIKSKTFGIFQTQQQLPWSWRSL